MTANEFPTLARAACLMAGGWRRTLTVDDQNLVISAVCFLFLPDQLTRAEAELRALTTGHLTVLTTGCEDDWPAVHDNTLRVLHALFDTLPLSA